MSPRKLLAVTAAALLLPASAAQADELIAPAPGAVNLAAGGGWMAWAAPGEDTGDFFVTWTRKEALLKATGDGLATPMSELVLGPGPRLVRWGGTRPRSSMWVRDLVVAPGHCAALAGAGVEAPPTEVRDGDALLATAGA